MAAIALSLATPLPPVPGLSLPALTQTSTKSAAKAEADRLLQQGIEQFQTSQFEAALQSWQQALKLYREIKDRLGEGAALGNLGLAYAALGDYGQAIAYQQQRLAIAREIKDRDGERIALHNIGSTLVKQHQPELAIVFYKQSVNVTETMRQAGRRLPRELQESYTQSVAGTYRRLADLLLA
jgi:tetratricopeptide (TPR) repeat protein